MAPRLDKAADKFEAFTGHEAREVYETRLDDHEVSGYRLGSMIGAAYEATRDGKTEQYFHKFSKKARPDLVARDDGKQLYVVGGDYKVTDRGIEDMAVPLFVVNPSSRSTRKRRKGRRSTFKANPVAKPRRRRRTSHRRRSSAVTVFSANPSRRRRRTRRAVTRYRSNPIHRHYARKRRSVGRYRRNPVSNRAGKGIFNIGRLLIPAATVGAAAVLVEIGMGYLSLPLALKTGPARHVAKAALSIGAGLLISKFVSRRWGEAIALGGVTISVHDMLKELIVQNAPGVAFGAASYPDNGFGYINAGPTYGEYVDSQPTGYGEYVYDDA